MPIQFIDYAMTFTFMVLFLLYRLTRNTIEYQIINSKSVSQCVKPSQVNLNSKMLCSLISETVIRRTL